MKTMTMTRAMYEAMKKTDAKIKQNKPFMDGEISRVFPLEGSGSKENGYDYLLIGVETNEWITVDGENYQETNVFEIAVNCNEKTNWKPKAEINRINLDV